jgi:membrane associated rhomboid family serine protease/Zn-finger nucleic acid-binding protein
MPNCPDHARVLVASEFGRTCPFCRGALTTEAEIESKVPGAAEVSAPETRTDALPFKKLRACPDCAAVMVPWRIGRLEAWLDRCPSCDAMWVEPGDLASLKLVTKSTARADAWASMDPKARAELAQDLADVPRAPEQATIGQTAQALVGVPVLSGLEGAQSSFATGISLLLLTIGFIAGLAAPASFGFEALAYRAERDSILGVIPAVFAHDGWFHGLGNLFFASLFGDAVERKSPHWLVPAMLFGGGAVTLMIDSLFEAPTSFIGGASGGVFGLMGLTLVLQRRGRWLVPLAGFRSAPLPLPFVMVLYVGFDVWLASMGASGIAWGAHGAGFLLGVLAAFLVRDRDNS